MQHSGMVTTKLGAVVVMSPLMLVPGSIVFVLGALCGFLYINAQLSAKREMSLAQGPVLGNFGAAISGLGSFIQDYDLNMFCLHQLHFSFYSGLRGTRTVSPRIICPH